MGPAEMCLMVELPTDCHGEKLPMFREGTQVYTLGPIPFENFVYSDPEFSWHEALGVTSIAFPDKDSFRKYTDWLFVGDANYGRIYQFQFNADRTGFVFSNPELSDLTLDWNDKIDESLFASNFHVVTDIKFRDGAMYVVSLGEGSIYKIYPKEHHLLPLKQYQNGVTHKEIVCKAALMPIMHGNHVDCVQPKTAITLVNVLDWSIDHPEMPKIDLKYQDLRGLNFEYINLSNSDFRRANFDTANISNVNFTGTHLSYTDLSGKDLTGTILTGAYLSYTSLAGVDLSGKDLTGTTLTGVDLSGMDLTGTILTGANLSDANLSNAILRHANLENASLENAKFLDANLSSANLTNADLRNALLVDANLSNAILMGADLTSTVLTGAILTGADLTSAVLVDAILNCINHPICA